ncbi:MAG: SiaB family protein kinase [Bacteroidota bacterium]|nr:SiaB family protein kinase [Candidatus Kapabacteria bacterium]MDW8220261.1 SiaB family protein kinase [Bacteroidota bacterium]
MPQSRIYAKFLTPVVGKTILEYEGVCSHECIVQLAQELEHTLAERAGVRFKKVFGIFVELIQNIRNYSAERSIPHDPESDGIGIIRISEETLCYTITAGNCIPKDAVARIRDRCHTIKSIPKHELRSRYNALLHSEQERTSKGAGVGFLDIALKSDGNWDYEFHLIGGGRTFFIITAHVARASHPNDT